eukprot:6197620-Pleurochrysis_carterae.AAC.3
MPCSLLFPSLVSVTILNLGKSTPPPASVWDAKQGLSKLEAGRATHAVQSLLVARATRVSLGARRR